MLVRSHARVTLAALAVVAVMVSASTDFTMARAATAHRAVSVFSTSDPFAKLSVTDRLRLPDSTIVKYKNGGSTTVGALRANHNAILANLRATIKPPSLGTIDLVTGASKHGELLRRTAYPNTGSNNSIPFGRRLPIAQPTPADGMTYPADYVNACSGATICLYYPKNVIWTSSIDAMAAINSGNAAVEDPLADDAQCQQGGGYSVGEITSSGLSSVCVYAYPLTQTVSIDPSLVPSLQGACNNPVPFVVSLTTFTISVDGHAASGFKPNGVTDVGATGPGPQQCYMVVTMVQATPAPTPVPTARPSGTIQVNH